MKNKDLYWRPKSTTIDFSKIPDEEIRIVYKYNGGWSSEYNGSLWFVDVEEEDD